MSFVQNTANSSICVSLRPRATLSWLLRVIAALTSIHLMSLCVYFYTDGASDYRFLDYFDFDTEHNLPSFCSAVGLWISGALLALIHHKEGRGFSFPSHWGLLSFIFVLLGLDEATQLHERLGNLVESMELFKADGFLYFPWVVPYSLLLLVLAGYYTPFLVALPKRFRILFLGSGILFVSGAVGLEVVSAKIASIHGTSSLAYCVIYTFEELCEMLAIAFFIYSLLEYVAQELEEPSGGTAQSG